jgi:acetyltransferase-like isoleucine patch superfamily enzyme
LSVPIDRNHAFADGFAYARPPGPQRLVTALADLVSAVGRRGRVAQVWRTFDRRAAIGESCLLGLSAWCVNEGSRDRIRIGAGTACRGVLRRERFGNGEISIGRDVYIGDDCLLSCCERISIGDFTLLGHGVQIFDNNSHPIDADARTADWLRLARATPRIAEQIERAPVEIGAHVWIGFSSIVLKGVTIGEGAIVAAGSIVTSDVEAHMLAAGNPARPIRPLR